MSRSFFGAGIRGRVLRWTFRTNRGKGRGMGRALLAVLLVAAVLSPAAVGDTPTSVNGGGRGTVDGVNPFSQFGFQASMMADGSVQGHFNCLMAGSSQFPGFTLMAVRGEVTSLSISGGTATLEGSGVLIGHTGAPEKKFPATFQVGITDGGPGAGTLQLTVSAPAFSASTISLPTEDVLVGRISVG